MWRHCNGGYQCPDSTLRCHLASIGISIKKIRRSHERLTSYLYNENPYTDKTAPLYWISPTVVYYLRPRCQAPGCGGLLRPHVVWFGEGLDENVLSAAHDELEKCDLCLVVSFVMMTSSNGNIFPRNWPFLQGIHRSPMKSPYKGQWRESLMFSLICAWINCWVNNGEAGDLRRHRAHYDVIVMLAGSLDWLFRHNSISMKI